MGKDEVVNATMKSNDAGHLPDAIHESDLKALTSHSKHTKSGHTILTQATLRKPTWTYMHLTLHSSSPTNQPLDASTARLHLTAALKQFLGLVGEAIPVDFLKLEGRDFWLRVPREDGPAVVAALGGWVGVSDGATLGWRVKGRDDWLARLSNGDGMDLFSD